METWSWAARAVSVAGCLVLLAACGARGVDVVAAPASAVAPPETAQPRPEAPPTPTQLSAVSPAAGPRVPELLGLSRAEVARLLGAPTLLRREPPAEVWQYAGTSCVLHVFLYADPGGSRVAHYESVQRAGGRLTASDCYGRLLAEPRQSGSL